MTEKTVPKIDIYGEVSAKLNEPLRIMVWDDNSNMVTVETEERFEIATNTPLTKDRLKQQLQKTGSTPFNFSYLSLNMDDNITMPISVINKIRREVLEQLETKRSQRFEQRQKSDVIIELPNVSKQSMTPQLSVSVRNLKQLKIILERQDIETIYYKDIKTLPKAFELAADFNKEIIPQLPRIINDEEITKAAEVLKQVAPKTVMVGEYGMIEALKDSGYNLITDFAFNNNNAQSVEALKQLGISQTTLGYEMNQKQIRTLMKKASLPVEAIVFTRIPMMITKHCPVKLLNQPNQEFCRLCLTTPFGLRDRKDKILPLLRTGNCITEIFNAQHLILIEYLKELQDMGIYKFRLEFTNENEAEMHQAIAAYQNALQTKSIDQVWLGVYKDNQNYTKGHYHRGVE